MNPIVISGVIFVLSWLTIAYQAGTYAAASIFGWRVPLISIGMGPVVMESLLLGHTRFRVCVLPFMAYTQIDGMSPHEEHDPHDPGLYRNGSLWARVLTILAGPFACLVTAYVLFLVAAVVGRPINDGPLGVLSKRVDAQPALEVGDRISHVEGVAVSSVSAVAARLATSSARELQLTIERDGRVKQVRIKPSAKADGRYGIELGRLPIVRAVRAEQAPAEAARAVLRWHLDSVRAVGGLLEGGGVRHTSLASLSSSGDPHARDARTRIGAALSIAGYVAAALWFFNLLPFPSLNGGRLVFLLYETLTRRRANERVEATAHAIGLIVLVAVLALVTVRDLLPRGDEPSTAPQPRNEALREALDDYAAARRMHARWGGDEPPFSL